MGPLGLRRATLSLDSLELRITMYVVMDVADNTAN